MHNWHVKFVEYVINIFVNMNNNIGLRESLTLIYVSW